MSKLKFKVIQPSSPQKTGSKWYLEVKPTGEQFLIGQSVGYTDGDGKHRGLYQTAVLNEIPQLLYDRFASEAKLGLWSHFIWPSVGAESGNGNHLIINTYDRARFTFGFYQLAAHTPNANLILLFRRLISLPSAKTYFPDLILKNGRVHRVKGSSTYSLEKVTTVHRPNGKIEKQLVSFMTYLNPDTKKTNTREALNAGKLMYWLMSEPAALEAAEKVAFEIMHKKLRTAAQQFNLHGADPRIGIWISDIRHHGRGGSKKIRAALAKPTVKQQLEALSKVDIYTAAKPKGVFQSRRKSVQKLIKVLTKEQRFTGVTLGSPQLPL